MEGVVAGVGNALPATVLSNATHAMENGLKPFGIAPEFQVSCFEFRLSENMEPYT